MNDDCISMIGKIIKFAVVNNCVDTNAKDIPGKPVYFVEFSGHCPVLNIRIFPSGWHEYAVEESYSIYPDFWNHNEFEQIVYAYNRMVAIQKEWDKNHNDDDCC